MKERPILFTPDNAQKVHDGTKTQTRRTNGLDYINKNPSDFSMPEMVIQRRERSKKEPSVLYARFAHKELYVFIKCPYGLIGDRLWIRECWADVNTESGPAFMYRSGYLKFCQDDAYPVEYDRYPGSHFTMWCGDLMRGEPDHKWRPSLHMYRYACRTVVEITEIRVERVQDISDDDKIAEGCDVDTCMRGRHDQWIELWNSINGKDSWALNPLVWVISMRKVEL